MKGIDVECLLAAFPIFGMLFFFVRCMWGFARVSSWDLLVGICVGVGSSLGFGLFFCVCGILGVPYEYYGF